MMDVSQTLTFFDRFQANHKKTCGTEKLEVSFERPSESATTIVLACPVCGDTIRGSVSDTDMPQVIQLLKPEKAS
jgi:hypothetical protein